MTQAELRELCHLAAAANPEKLPKNHPLIVAMCDAAYGKAQNHKLKRQKEMWRALFAALRHLN